MDRSAAGYSPWDCKESDRSDLEPTCTLECSFTTRTFLVAQMVKRLSTMRETLVRVLGWQDPLEEEVTTHSSVLA